MDNLDRTQTMKVLFLCNRDFANLGYLFAECLKANDVSAICMKVIYNPRKSVIGQGTIIKSKEHLRPFVESADVIIWMHSQYVDLSGMNSAGKTFGVFHGGTKYRRSAKRVNKLFNPKIDFTLTQSTEGTMLNRGAKNESWVFPPVDTTMLQPSYDMQDKIIIGHFPSQPKAKGSTQICSVINKLRNGPLKDHFTYMYGGSLVPWKRNLINLAYCDIYIDSITHAGWGLAILEAAALGTIGVAGFGLRKEYEELYGPCPLPDLAAHDLDGLYNILETLILTDRKELIEKKKEYRQWVENYHTIEFIGKELKRTITNAIR